MNSVQCVGYCVECIVYSVLDTVLNVYCVQCVGYCEGCIVCTVCTVWCKTYSVVCTMCWHMYSVNL